MADQSHADNGTFVKAFLPGMVLGLLVGLAIGSFVVPMLDRAPKLGGPVGQMPAGGYAPRDERARDGENPAAVPAPGATESDVKKPEEKKPEEAKPAGTMTPVPVVPTPAATPVPTPASAPKPQ